MSEEESKAQKTKASVISRAKAEAPPKEPDGSLRILMPITPGPAATDPPKSGDNEIELEAPEQTETDLLTPHAPGPRSSPIPTIIEPELEIQPDIGVEPSGSTGPRLTMSPALEITPVSGDVLLPMIIFSVVKANPPHLVSNLLYTQRFRNQSIGGEEGYCLINLMAVAEFLENVDLAALGLGDSDKVMR